jgi:membrane fusion protein, multidrug efflux system
MAGHRACLADVGFAGTGRGTDRQRAPHGRRVCLRRHDRGRAGSQRTDLNLPVRDNQTVKKGDVLFAIDARPYLAALARGKAALAALDQQIALTQRTVDAQQYNAASFRAAVGRAKAAAMQASDTLRRMEPLLPNGYVSADEVDRARTAQRAPRAEWDAAELQARQAAAAVGGIDAFVAQRAVVLAEISLAELNVDYATVVSPFDGRVVSLKTSTGQFASALKPVFTLVDTRRWYVIANFRETELRHIRAGMRATVCLMSDSDIRFDGVVESIGYGVLPDDGGLSIGGLPRIQRSLNWVRVAQRFPVRIDPSRHAAVANEEIKPTTKTRS